MSSKKKKPEAEPKNDVQPIMELAYDDEVAKYYVSSNPEKTQFMLCIVTNKRMNNDDVIMALDVFAQDAEESGLNLMDDPEFSGNDH